ncbi:MAG TPA: flagellar biosynthetic protein FliR [Caulobacteraceae bacterium]|jgi:flagellar biosynthetic protein FliR
MEIGLSVEWIFSSFLLSLRLAPVFAFAPPFSMTQVPVLFRSLFGVGLAACMISTSPPSALISDLSLGSLVLSSVRELALGMIFVLALQMMFAALYVAGRTLDIQSGFGLAVVINPATGEQDPLIGTLFAYAAAATFFAMNGHADLLRIVRASLDAIPLGSGGFPTSIVRMTSFISTMFVVAFGVAGGAILCLFLADLSIAMLSRTVPQMNVLILGLQVKTLLILLVLPATLGFTGALLARMVAITLQSIPELL